MPWLHLHVDTSGRVKACCNANITFGNITNQSLEEIWQGEPIRNFRKALMSNKKDKRCASCYLEEEAGKSSVRKETLEKFSSRLDWVDQTNSEGFSQNSKPIYLDIRFSNLCNLRCRTCWHGASSSWFDEAKILKNNLGNQAIIQADSGPELIGQLKEMAVEVEEIYFAGGEPLMMAEHYDLLECLITKDNKKVHLRYNTNLSVLSLKGRSVLDLWTHFEKVTVSASIDAIGKQGEYIRKGLNWNRFENHMKMIKAAVPHVQLEIAPTISVFNALSLAETHRYFVEKSLIGLNAIYLNVLSRPDYYNIKVLPEKIKEKTKALISEHVKWLVDNGAKSSLIAEFESIVSFMTQDDWSDRLPKLRDHVSKLDEMRSENFNLTFPDLVEEIGPF